MQKLLCLLLCIGVHVASVAQVETAEGIVNKSSSFSKSGDYENAIMILKRGEETYNYDVNITMALANVYALAGRYKDALPYAKKLAALDEIPLQAVQIVGNVFSNNNENSAYEKLYKKAFKLYPDSGGLYAEYGEYLLSKEKIGCIASWEKGMKADPNYAGNYYFASKYYDANNNILLSTWCAENFINMEYQSTRTNEVKTMLLKNFRTILTNTNLQKEYEIKGNNFFKAYLACLNTALNGASANGINTESLALIRARFIIIWNSKYEGDFACKLFEYHRQLLIDGTFEAYNQWLFGSIENFNVYQNWIVNNNKAYDALTKYRTNRLYKIPVNQYYGL